MSGNRGEGGRRQEERERERRGFKRKPRTDRQMDRVGKAQELYAMQQARSSKRRILSVSRLRSSSRFASARKILADSCVALCEQVYTYITRIAQRPAIHIYIYISKCID